MILPTGLYITESDISFRKAGGYTWIMNNKQGHGTDINHTESKEMQHREVFTLGFDHGTTPHNATYAYIIAPG